MQFFLSNRSSENVRLALQLSVKMENTLQAKPLRRENGKQCGIALKTIRTRVNLPIRNQDRNGQNLFHEAQNKMYFLRDKNVKERFRIK